MDAAGLTRSSRQYGPLPVAARPAIAEPSVRALQLGQHSRPEDPTGPVPHPIREQRLQRIRIARQLDENTSSAAVRACLLLELDAQTKSAPSKCSTCISVRRLLITLI